MPGVVGVGRPEARRVGRQHLVAQHELVVGVEAELELGVGDDDAALVAAYSAAASYSSIEIRSISSNRSSPTRSLPVARSMLMSWPSVALALPPISCGAGSKPTCQDKKLAQEDLRSQLPGLANECAIATIGLGGLVVGAAAPEIGIASVLAAAGPTGAEIVALAGPVCALLIKRIYDDAKIIEDPPIASLHKLARPAKPHGAAVELPSCKRLVANVRVYCTKLRADASRYATAVRRSVAVDDALLITVDRVSGAFKAHNKGALALQKRQASSLRAQLLSAHREQQRAGAAIIKLVKFVGLQASISESQQQQGIAKANAGLSKRGTSTTQAQHLGGVSLNTAATDALAQLAL